jgi:malonyl-CoA O-methyltransferase
MFSRVNSFDRAAPDYDRFACVQRELADWLAEWLPEERKGVALEMAAGTGLFTKHLLPWDGRLIATDASPAMVEMGTANYPHAEWRIARAEDPPDVSADWIFSSSYLQWAQEPALVARRWRARLAAGGRVLAGFFVTPTLPEIAAVLPDFAPLHWRPPAEWEMVFAEAGLGVQRSEATTRTIAFPSALALFRHLHGTGAAPVRRANPSALRRAFKEYDLRYPCPGGVRSTWTFFRMEARDGR